jgi:hypothetical protein
MYEPSVDAKYFCSFTANMVEFTKLAPPAMAAAFAVKQQINFFFNRHLKSIFFYGGFPAYFAVTFLRRQAAPADCPIWH